MNAQAFKTGRVGRDLNAPDIPIRDLSHVKEPDVELVDLAFKRIKQRLEKKEFLDAWSVSQWLCGYLSGMDYDSGLDAMRKWGWYDQAEGLRKSFSDDKHPDEEGN